MKTTKKTSEIYVWQEWRWHAGKGGQGYTTIGIVSLFKKSTFLSLLLVTSKLQSRLEDHEESRSRNKKATPDEH